MGTARVLIVKGSPREHGNSAKLAGQDTFGYIPAEIVGLVYGYASDAGEIRDSRNLMQSAYELGKKLGSRD
jgi:hypothetical protein